MLGKRSEREVWTFCLGQTDRLTLCTEHYLARRKPSSEGLANPGRVGAALRSLPNCGGGVGRELHRRSCCSVQVLCQICCSKSTEIVLKKIQL